MRLEVSRCFEWGSREHAPHNWTDVQNNVIIECSGWEESEGSLRMVVQEGMRRGFQDERLQCPLTNTLVDHAAHHMDPPPGVAELFCYGYGPEITSGTKIRVKKVFEFPSYVTINQINEQREKGWPDFHPEDYCHKCGNRNIPSWSVDSDRFNAALGPYSNQPYNGIICPPCFVLLHQEATGLKCTWELRPHPMTPFRPIGNE